MLNAVDKSLPAAFRLSMPSDRRSRRHPLRRIASVTLLALLALGSISCFRAPRTFVGLIVLDAARPDRFSSYGHRVRTTPEIDLLATEGTVFLNHFSPHTHTRASLPSMFFARYFTPPLFPSNNKVPLATPVHLFRRADSASLSLPRLLSRSGYHTVLVSAHTWMRPGTAIADEFDEVHDLSTLLEFPSWQGYPDARGVVDYLLERLAAEADLDRSLFVYLHLMDTHFPHILGVDARRNLEASGLAPEEVEPAWRHYLARQRDYFGTETPISERDKLVVDALYDGSLRFTDRELGRLFDHLRNSVEYERTVLAVTSDHGEELGEVPGRFGHGGPWYDLAARVPLIVAGDGVPVGRFRHLSDHVDLNPTLLSALRMAPPEGVEFDGGDLFAVARGDAPPREYVTSTNGIRNERYKALYWPGEALLEDWSTDQPPDFEQRLFDLANDPLEEHDVSAAEPLVAERLIEAFRSRLRLNFRRYARTYTNEPPPSPFAIGALHFRLFEPATGDDVEDPESLRQLDIGWPDFRLLVPPGRAAAFQFEIPDGVYQVSVSFAGEGTLEIEDGAPQVALSGPPVAQDVRVNDMEKRLVDLGTVRVTDTRFAAHARGAGSEGLLVRHLGFEPAATAARERTQEDIEAEERLRSLGYID